MTFANDPVCQVAAVWAAECANRGVYLVPWHNWFISTAHDDQTIDQALDATMGAFEVVAKQIDTVGHVVVR